MTTKSSEVAAGDQAMAEGHYNFLRDDALGDGAWINKSGSSQIAGTVVILDTSNDDAFTVTTTKADIRVIGVVGETIADSGSGLVQDHGVVDVTVDEATTRGDWLTTASTAGQATPRKTPCYGAFARASGSTSGPGTVTAELLLGAIPGGLEDAGDMLFTTDDLLLLDFQRWRADDDLIGSRLERIVHSGALRYVPGRWQGTRALAVEPAGTNYMINPVFSANVTDGWTNNGMATYERSTAQSRFGAASMHLVSDATADDVYSDTVSEADGGEDWTAVVWVYLVSGDFQVTIEENDGGWSDKGSQAGGVVGQWTRVVLSVELTAGVTDGRVKLEPAATAASEFYVGYVGFHPTAYALTAIYGSAGTGYAWTGASDNSTSTRTATEVNLDAHVGPISGNDTLTFATWVQMPYSHDATWPQANENYIFDIRKDATNQILSRYRAGITRLDVSINVAVTLNIDTLTFAAGDWMHIATTLDFGSDSYKLYVDGALVDSDTTATAAPTGLTAWRLGNDYNGGRESGLIFDEYATFDCVLTAAEIATLYARQGPLIDEGALDNEAEIDGIVPYHDHSGDTGDGGALGAKLDDLAAPDDNTDLNASTSAHGLCPKGDDDTTHFLRGDLTWTVGTVPSGFIGMWHGTVATIPAGWVICDGNNSTPNLLDKFVKSVPNIGTDPGGTGGESTHALTEAELAAHTHTIAMLDGQDSGQPTGGAGGASTNAVTNSTGSGSAHENKPPYYEVAFIMKT